MGRKRTSKKKKVLISVDEEIYDRLVEWKVNRSVLFTHAALEYLVNLEKEEKSSIKK